MSTAATELVQQSKTIKKHINVVHVGTPLSLLERKLFNVLLVNSYPQLNNNEHHRINISVLCELIDYDSKDVSKLKEALRRLSTTAIEWMVFDKKKEEKEWGVTTYISGWVIQKGVCEYGYSPFLKKKLHNPEMYASINLQAQKKFSSRYSLALYENCARFRPNEKKNFSGGTPEWTLEQFCILMGVGEKESYRVFRNLNKRILAPAVKEVNQWSDIIVTPILIKEGRKYAKIKFDVKDNPQLSFDLSSEYYDNALVKEMEQQYGIPEMMALEWIGKYGEERFQEVLSLVNNRIKKGELKNPVGFIRKAFEEEYKPWKSTSDIQQAFFLEEQKKAHLEEQKKEKERAQKRANKRLLEDYIKGLSEQKKTDLTQAFYKQEIQPNAFLSSHWANGEYLKSAAGKVTFHAFVQKQVSFTDKP